MSMFGSESDWGIIVAVGGSAIGCVMFVINQVKEARSEFSSKLSGVKSDIVRVEDEASRKISAAHSRIDHVDDEIHAVERDINNKITELWKR